MRTISTVLSLAAVILLAGCNRQPAAQEAAPPPNYQPQALQPAPPPGGAAVRSAAPGTRRVDPEPTAPAATAPATTPSQPEAAGDDRPRQTATKTRSKKKSAAIIGGSAAAGAAVGAIAGGGKGAAIGAIAGGAGGLVYDRATAKKKKEQ